MNVTWWKKAYADRARLDKRWLDEGVTKGSPNWYKRKMATYPRLTLEGFDMTPDDPKNPVAKFSDEKRPASWCRRCWRATYENQGWNRFTDRGMVGK